MTSIQIAAIDLLKKRRFFCCCSEVAHRFTVEKICRFETNEEKKLLPFVYPLEGVKKKNNVDFGYLMMNKWGETKKQQIRGEFNKQFN